MARPTPSRLCTSMEEALLPKQEQDTDEKRMLNNLETTMDKITEIERDTWDDTSPWVPGIKLLMDSARRLLNEVYEVNKELLSNQQQGASGSPLTDAEVAGLEEKKKKAWMRAKSLVEWAFVISTLWREDREAKKEEMAPVPNTPKLPKH